MVRHPRAALALLIATILVAGMPATIHAADAAPAGDTPAGWTPLDTNLLQNGSFERVADDGSIPSWEVEGGVHVERFGDRPWPYPAYGAKYHGGERYLACSGRSGLVRQSAPFTGWPDRDSFWIKARVQVDFGGRIAHTIRVTLRATGPGVDRVNRDTKPLIITDHYKRSVARLVVPPGTTQLTATIELLGVQGGAKCRMAADSVKMTIFKH